MIILLTDGSYNAGEVEPLQAAQVAGAYGIRIYAIGAGTRGVALMPTRSRDGSVNYAPRSKARSPLDYGLFLERLAQAIRPASRTRAR